MCLYRLRVSGNKFLKIVTIGGCYTMIKPVKTGTILKEYLAAKNIFQEDVARITNSSTRHVSCVINGKQKLSYEFALKLEKVFPDIKAEFWLDIEQYYRLNLLRSKEIGK